MDWLVQSEQDVTEPPATFLSAQELLEFDSLRFLKRRSEWLLGRWTAKRLAQAVLARNESQAVSLTAIEIFNDADGAPHAYVDGQPLALELSISHSHGSALCAVDTCRIGADLEWIEPRPDGLINDFFTVSERAQVNTVADSQRAARATAIWSAKEAALKALRKGLTLDTREVEVAISGGESGLEAWAPFALSLYTDNPMPLRGWWRQANGFVLTLAMAGTGFPCRAPISPLPV